MAGFPAIGAKDAANRQDNNKKIEKKKKRTKGSKQTIGLKPDHKEGQSLGLLKAHQLVHRVPLSLEI